MCHVILSACAITGRNTSKNMQARYAPAGLPEEGGMAVPGLKPFALILGPFGPERVKTLLDFLPCVFGR